MATCSPAPCSRWATANPMPSGLPAPVTMATCPRMLVEPYLQAVGSGGGVAPVIAERSKARRLASWRLLSRPNGPELLVSGSQNAWRTRRPSEVRAPLQHGEWLAERIPGVDAQLT